MWNVCLASIVFLITGDLISGTASLDMEPTQALIMQPFLNTLGEKNGKRGSVFAACPDAQSHLCPGSLAGHCKKVFLRSEGSMLCSTHKQLMDI